MTYYPLGHEQAFFSSVEVNYFHELKGLIGLMISYSYLSTVPLGTHHSTAVVLSHMIVQLYSCTRVLIVQRYERPFASLEVPRQLGTAVQL